MGRGSGIGSKSAVCIASGWARVWPWPGRERACQPGRAGLRSGSDGRRGAFFAAHLLIEIGSEGLADAGESDVASHGAPSRYAAGDLEDVAADEARREEWSEPWDVFGAHRADESPLPDGKDFVKTSVADEDEGQRLPEFTCLGAADGGERWLLSSHAFELRGDGERLAAGGLRENNSVEGFLLDVEAASACQGVLFPEERCVDQALAAAWGTIRLFDEVQALSQAVDDGAQVPGFAVEVDEVRTVGRVRGFETPEFSTGVVEFAAYY